MRNNRQHAEDEGAHLDVKCPHCQELTRTRAIFTLIQWCCPSCGGRFVMTGDTTPGDQRLQVATERR